MEVCVLQLCYGYIRCSTDEQTLSGLGVDSQRSAILSYCSLKALTLNSFIEDLGESGGIELAERPGGAKLLQLVTGKTAIVIVAKLDRLTRNAGDFCRLIGEYFTRGIILVSLAESLDVTTPHGKAMAQICAVFAELERALIGDRTKLAMEVKRGRGERLTRFPRYGWSWAPSGRANADGEPIMVQVINEEEQAALRRMRIMRRHGSSFAKIAEEMNAQGRKTRRGNDWNAVAVQGVLRRARAQGHKKQSAGDKRTFGEVSAPEVSPADPIEGG